jgi:predicted ATPase/DNA-binding CsgD family transcriptional regulator
MSNTPRPSRKNTLSDHGSVVEIPSATEGGRPPNNLPLQLTSFVGREREMAEASKILDTERLLTLAGPGGSGKTRLALAVASEVIWRFQDGVWFVELASLSDPDLVPQTVGAVLGVRERPGVPLVEELRAHLQTRRVLLVLDNCEHLVEACADLAEALLGSCPDLHILATSREALGVPGEMLYPVPPLSLPDPRLPKAEDLVRYEAAKLFVDRATAVRHDFTLTETNTPAVAQICYRLDGMPLAIEFAAARMKVLSAEQISSRLDDSFALLAGGGRTALARQRTLRATMEWSHELLSEKERILFRRLSVFAGGFTLGAAETVGSGEDIEEGGVLDLLTALVNKSLVLVTEQGDEARYRLLETVRQFGLERLEECGEVERIRRRHVEYYLAIAQETEPESREQGSWLRRLETERGNFRAALGWALGKERVGSEEAQEDRAALGLRLAVSLGQGRFWAANGLSEGLRWLEKGLATSGDALPDTVRATALNEAGWIATVQGDQERAVVLLEESFALSKKLGDKSGIAASLVQLGQLLVMYEGDHERVAGLREEAETLRAELLDPSQTAYLIMFLAQAAWYRRDHEQALALFEEGLALFRDMGNLQGTAFCLGSLGFITLEEDEPTRAATIFEEALRTLETLRDRVGIFHCLLGAASVVGLRGDPASAARLWGAAEALGETAAIPLIPLIRSGYDYAGHLDAARSRLSQETFEAAWAEGRNMTPEQAIEYALNTLETQARTEIPPPTDPSLSYPAGLSAREVEVLHLVARGMTNAQIAKELFISPRTVNAHLGSVYHKIGSSTRAEATRFATEHGLL